MPLEISVKLKDIEEWQVLGDYNSSTAATFILILKGNPVVEDVRYKDFIWKKEYTDTSTYSLAIPSEDAK